MRYSYSAAWSVIGGITLPGDSEAVELCNSKTCRFVLTRDPDSLLANVERGAALGSLMLKGLFGPQTAAAFPIALEAEIERIRAERKKRTGAHTVLVIEANGEIDASISEPTRELEEFIVTFDAINKGDIRRAYQSEIDKLKLAISLESETPFRFSLLAEGAYLYNEAGKIVYSITFSMSAEGVVSSNLSAEGCERISARYDLLQKSKDFDSVQRLFSQMADSETERLKAFLSGWAALEIFIGKAFNIYEQVFLSPLKNAAQATLRDRFLNRVRDVMKDKYRLTDKFAVVAAVLFPTAPDIESEDDYKMFCRLKKLRDSISHSDEFVENNLPVHAIAKILRKYVVAYLAETAAPSPFARRDS